MAVLSTSEIEERLQHLPGWALIEGEIVRQATFKDFLSAMEFVDQVAVMAENEQHHPDIDIRYNKVKLALTSHDAGGLTKQDFEMARAMEALISKSAAA
jgi:4a-hydroxytetrahydrobiopterin dehydratase